MFRRKEEGETNTQEAATGNTTNATAGANNSGTNAGVNAAGQTWPAGQAAGQPFKQNAPVMNNPATANATDPRRAQAQPQQTTGQQSMGQQSMGQQTTASMMQKPEQKLTAIPPIATANNAGNTNPNQFGNTQPHSQIEHNDVQQSPSLSTNSSYAEQTNAQQKPQNVLTVGVGILLKGEIATCDLLVISGQVDANLNKVKKVEISTTGSFKGKADIESAEISGTFEGDMMVRGLLMITASGKVSGNVTYGAIEIERGGCLSGNVRMGSDVGGESKGGSGSGAGKKIEAIK